MRKLFSAFLAAVLSVSLFAPAVYGAATTKQPEGFYGLDGKIVEVNLYDETRMVAYNVGWKWGSPLGPYGGVIVNVDKNGEFIDMKQDNSYLTALAPKPLTGEQGKQLTPIGSMDILLENDTKFTYTFYENGITVAKALPGKAAGKAMPYSVNKKAYQTLLGSLAVATKERKSNTQSPSWLLTMRHSRAIKLTIQAAGKTRTLTPEHKNFLGVFESMRRFYVKPDSMRVVKEAKPPETGSLVTIDFNSKVRYTIEVQPKTITIYINDRDYALRYDSVKDETAPLAVLVQPNGKLYPPDT